MGKTLSRALAVILAALTLLAVWHLYRGYFGPLDTEAQKLAAIRTYTAGPRRAELQPVLLHDETFGDSRILTFTDSEIDGLLGNVQFRRGPLGGWQPIHADCCTGPVVRSAAIYQQDIRVFYAGQCPPEIARYQLLPFFNQSGAPIAEGPVVSGFFHSHAITEDARDIPTMLALFDGSGQRLDAPDYLAVDQSAPELSLDSDTSTVFLDNSAILLLAGFLPAAYLWNRGLPPLKKKETA